MTYFAHEPVRDRGSRLRSSLKNWTLACVALFLLVGSGCSTFQRDFKSAARLSHGHTIEGAWMGSWQSDSSRHGDKLRCIIRKVANNEYEARFHAKYKKILGFHYTAHFRGTMTNEVFQFKGEADLGKLAGGTYHYAGHISPADFKSRYDSKYDHGTFDLHRP